MPGPKPKPTATATSPSPSPSNSNEIRVAGTGRVLVAALGTDAPVRTTAPWAPGWTDLGHTSAEGITFIKRDDRDRVDTWRSVSAARYVYSGRDLSLTFVLMRPNEDAPPLVSGNGNGNRMPDKRMLAVEFADGETVKYRFVIPRGHFAEAGTGAAGAGVTFTALAEDGDDAAPLATLLMTDLVHATA